MAFVPDDQVKLAKHPLVAVIAKKRVEACNAPVAAAGLPSLLLPLCLWLDISEASDACCRLADEVNGRHHHQHASPFLWEQRKGDSLADARRNLRADSLVTFPETRPPCDLRVLLQVVQAIIQERETTLALLHFAPSSLLAIPSVPKSLRVRRE